MKTLFTIPILFLSLFAEADSWTQKISIWARVGSFSFSIGNKGYVGTGYQRTFQDEVYKDFWEYDASSSTWTQKADYGGGQTEFGFGFSILNKGYAGAGLNNNFYEYDPSTNSWTQKASFHSRLDSGTGFSIGNLGYVCLGDDSAPTNEVWRYDPSSDVWTRKNNFPSLARYGALAFSIGTKAYVGSGYSDIGDVNDFWEYSPVFDSWTQKADVPGLGRHYASGFSICNKGYATIGKKGSLLLNDLWEYDTTANQWTQKTNFPGPNRECAACFSIGNNAYVGTGGTVDFSIGTYFGDFYEYTPDSNACFSIGIHELQSSSFQFQVSPNPAKDVIVCSFGSSTNKKVEISIFDAMGRLTPCPISTPYPLKGESAPSPSLAGGEYLIDVSSFSEGLYFIVATDGEEKAVKKFVKE